MSSTVIIVKILYDKRELETLAGRVTLGVLVLQDVATILFLAVQPNLKHPTRPSCCWPCGMCSCCYRWRCWPAGSCCRMCSGWWRGCRSWCWWGRWRGVLRWRGLQTP